MIHEEKQGQDIDCPNDVGASEVNDGCVDEKRERRTAAERRLIWWRRV